MLVTPIFPNETDVAKWRTMLRTNGHPNWEYIPPTVLQEGVIVGRLNMNADLKLHNIFDEYPVFRSDDWMIRHFEKALTEDCPDNPRYRAHAEKELAKYKAALEYKSLYRHELWKPVWERCFKYDSPEERSAKIRENPEYYAFENYEPSLGSYGVCDTPEQLLAMYDFEADPRKLFIRFTEMRKEDQSPEGGWRWHKWGEYLGTQNPQYEYLYDEEDIESVYVFHIYELLGEK